MYMSNRKQYTHTPVYSKSWSRKIEIILLAAVKWQPRAMIQTFFFFFSKVRQIATVRIHLFIMHTHTQSPQWVCTPDQTVSSLRGTRVFLRGTYSCVFVLLFVKLLMPTTYTEPDYSMSRTSQSMSIRVSFAIHIPCAYTYTRTHTHSYHFDGSIRQADLLCILFRFSKFLPPAGYSPFNMYIFDSSIHKW